MPKFLSLDTATEACSCALYLDGEIHHAFELIPRQHADRILPMADKLLADAGMTPRQLDAIVFGQGPGSFTGLRIACGVTQGIAFAADLPVIPVSTLATLAQMAYQTQQSTQVLAALDARMQEVYWGAFQLSEGIMQGVTPEQVSAPESVLLPTTEVAWYGIGSGWDSYSDSLQQRCHSGFSGYSPKQYPDAAAMVPLALAAWQRGVLVSAAHALPVYLRNEVVG